MKDDKCFLCGRNRHAGLEVHHIFSASNRKKSDRYGLVVTLCADCHRLADHAVHRDAETMQYLHEYGQRKAMQEQGWTVQQFMEVFGKNYVPRETKEENV